MRPQNALLALITLILCVGTFARAGWSQQMSNLDRGRVLNMLDQIDSDIRKNYYDPKLHGVNWDAEVQTARQAIKAETSLNMSFAHIAEALDAFNDSHTFFLPPPRPFKLEYGFQAFMVGNRCLIERVRPGSDAEAKGVKPGDEILDYGGYPATRDTLWKVDYFFHALHPQEDVSLKLRDPGGRVRQVNIQAKFKQLPMAMNLTSYNDFMLLVLEGEKQAHLMRAREQSVGDDVMVLKFPEFNLGQAKIDDLIGEARKYNGLIVDLRGNGGGAVDSLESLLGAFFKDKIKIFDRVGRKKSEEEFDKPRGQTFEGKVIVLVDSESASASELFARVMQLEKRGIVMGDRSSGSVMESVHHSYKVGQDSVIFFGASITDADLIMKDGKSLEHNGVQPDEPVLPTADDLAKGRDPVLARAAAVLGAKLTPEDAGKMFPYEWPKP